MTRLAGVLAVLSVLLQLSACSARDPIEVHEERTQTANRLVIDLRPPADFAAGHRPGALNLQSGWNQLEERVAAYIPDRATPVTLCAANPERARDAARSLLEAGYRDVQVATAAGGPASLILIEAAELRRRLAGSEPPRVIDVRSSSEYATGIIPGAILAEQDRAPSVLAHLDPAGTYAVICEEGWRSSQAASWMKRHGFDDVVNVIDGMNAWRELPGVELTSEFKLKPEGH